METLLPRETHVSTYPSCFKQTWRIVMKLFYKPGACSMAAHIVLNEIGTEFELEKVDTAAGLTETGADFKSINPRGYVPVLELDDNSVITENAAILQLLVDQAGHSELAPANGTIERTRLQEQLSFLSSELHKAYSPFFSGRDFTAEEKESNISKLSKTIGYFEDFLPANQPYMNGANFSVADAYAFVILNWSNFIDVSLEPWAKVKAYVENIASRPATQKALRTEGLIS
jgi:glutathione S-transferase